jgi:NADH dehydrogenase FAD-containing subunit
MKSLLKGAFAFLFWSVVFLVWCLGLTAAMGVISRWIN